MTQPPGLGPEQFHELLTDAVDGFMPASPPIEALQRRALRRRRGRRAAFTLTVTAVITGSAIVGIAVSTSADDAVTVTPATPRPTPRESPSHSLASEYPNHCGHRYSRWHFIQVVSASHAANEQAVGHPGYVRCGGPSDIAYLSRKTTETLTLAPGATVRVVHFGNTGPGTRPIAPVDLRAYVNRHDQTNFFRYAGPKQAITKLVELYHP